MATKAFWRFDRWGNQLGSLPGVISAKHEEELNGADTLTLTMVGGAVEKGDRIVFSDSLGTFHEQIVGSVKDAHTKGPVVCTATCESALQELNGDYITDLRPTGSALVCLQSALSNSRILPGTVDVTGTQHLSYYHVSALEAVRELVNTFGAELRYRVAVTGGEVTARYVDVLTRRGSVTAKRFSYGRDLTSIDRTVELTDVVTALYGYGAGVALEDEETGEETGGYSRKITFGEVNGGCDYITDEDALELWGRPDGSGGKAHVFGTVEFSDCEDPTELLALTRAALPERTVPTITYTASVVDLKAAGLDAEGLELGDTVQIVDRAFDPELRLEGRVLKVSEDLCDPTKTTLTLGNIQQGISSTVSGLTSLTSLPGAVGQLYDHAGSWNSAANVSESYLGKVVAALNDAFGAGGSYQYTGFDIGTIWASCPLDEDGHATQTPATAIQLCGAGLRIASGIKADGSWDWRTFGTGEGFTADCITAGVIRGGSNYWNLNTGDLFFDQGGIRSSDGSNYWNLTTGEFQLAAQTLKDNGVALSASTISGVDVEYALGSSRTTSPATGWSTTAPEWEDGKAMWQRVKTTYADGSTTYSDTTCISGATGPAGRDGTDGVPGRDGRDGTDGVPGKDGTDGKDGRDGVPGRDGVDGKDGRDGVDGTSNYVHIKYSPVASPTSASQMTETPSEYIGICVNTSQADPDTPSSYTWSKWQGKDGTDGIPGTNGTDGTSTYVHFAYSTSSNGASNFSTTPFDSALYVGVRTDTVVADSTNHADYQWSRMQGNGATAIEEQWYLSTSNSSQAGGAWSGTQPAWVSGKYLWTRSKVTWTDGSVTYTDPVLAAALNSANEEAKAAIDAVASLDNSLDQSEIFNRLTNDGQTQGIYLQDGKLYINGTYIQTGVITGGNGNSWDLSTGNLVTTYELPDELYSETASFTTYTQVRVTVEMTEDTPLGVFRNERRKLVNNTSGATSYTAWTKTRVGGVYITDDGTVALQSARCGVSELDFITAGQRAESSRQLGFSLAHGDEYFSVDALKGNQSPIVVNGSTFSADEIDGVGFTLNGCPFLKTYTNSSGELVTVLRPANVARNWNTYSSGYPYMSIKEGSFKVALASDVSLTLGGNSEDGATFLVELGGNNILQASTTGANPSLLFQDESGSWLSFTKNLFEVCMGSKSYRWTR